MPQLRGDRRGDAVRDELRFELIMREAIASVALSHDEDCNCHICRAAVGDQDAYQWIMQVISG